MTDSLQDIYLNPAATQVVRLAYLQWPSVLIRHWWPDPFKRESCLCPRIENVYKQCHSRIGQKQGSNAQDSPIRNQECMGMEGLAKPSTNTQSGGDRRVLGRGWLLTLSAPLRRTPMCQHLSDCSAETETISGDPETNMADKELIQ